MATLFFVLIAAGAPAAAELCAPPSGTRLDNPRWAAGEEIVLRLGGFKPGAQETAALGLAPFFDAVVGAAPWPWRYASPEETATLTFIVYKPDGRHPSAGAAIGAFFGDDAEGREAFVSKLTGDIQFQLSKVVRKIDLTETQDGPAKINVPKLVSTAPRIVAVPFREEKAVLAPPLARGLVPAVGGASDVVDAVACETYKGIFESPFKGGGLSEDDLKLLRGK